MLGLVPSISVLAEREIVQFRTGDNQDSRDKPESDSLGGSCC